MKKYKKVVIVGACYLLAFMLLSAAMPILRDGLSALNLEKKDNGRTEAADTDVNEKTDQDEPAKQPEQKQEQPVEKGEQPEQKEEQPVGELEFTIDENGNAVVTGIGTYALPTLVIPDTYKGHKVTKIAAGAFGGNKKLTDVVIPDSVQTIGDFAFSYCSQLQSVILSNNLTELPQMMFTNCESLVDVTIPAGVTTIGASAFYNCTALREITLPSRLTSLGTNVFSYCSSLQTVSFPDKITELPDGTCQGCFALEKLVLPRNLKKIGNHAVPGYQAATQMTVYYPLSREDWSRVGTGLYTNGGINADKIVYNYSGS